MLYYFIVPNKIDTDEANRCVVRQWHKGSTAHKRTPESEQKKL